MSEQCIHGMNPAWCGTCKRLAGSHKKIKSSSIIPTHVTEQSSEVKIADLHPLLVKRIRNIEAGVPSKTADIREGLVMGDYAIVRTIGVGIRSNPNLFSHLDTTITMVHVDGHLFVWALKVILERTPNLKKLRLIPSAKVTDTHIRMLDIRGVELVRGHHNLSLAWKVGEIRRDADYDKKLAVIKGLRPEGVALFEELISMGFEDAVIVSRYFCLKGETGITQRKLGIEFGGPNTYISLVINSVLHYLDPSFEASIQAQRRSSGIKSRVCRTRILIGETEKMKEFLSSLGISALPEGMPMSHVDTLEVIHMARQSGKLESLYLKNPRAYEILCSRWGIKDGRFRTFEEIGKTYSVTRERIRQIQQKAFVELGINADAD